MNVEEALEIVQSVIDNGSLSKVQEIVFRHCWERQSYMEIALKSGYEVGYIRDVGCKLWQSLSKAFGKKVTKNNFQGILKHQCMLLLSRSPDRIVNKWQPIPENGTHLSPARAITSDSQQDWGDAIDVSVFYGRATELTTLKQWLLQDRCRLVTLLGMGGIGKSSLAVKLAEQVQDQFQYLIWQSLRNAPPLTELLREIVEFLSGGAALELPDSFDAQLSCLMTHLRSSRCLLILDNYESILRSGERAGRYCAGYERYGELLRRVADEHHQSCLILTSREKPVGIAARESKTLPVRSLQLSGLPPVEAQQILQDKGIVNIDAAGTQQLIDRYHGNPLALKITAATIQNLFAGDAYKFLDQGTLVFGDLFDLLDQQFSRLSPIEMQVMRSLANYHRWVTLSELRECCLTAASQRELLEALNSLQQRSLIERHSVSFTQQSMVTEYISVMGVDNLPCFC